MSIGLGILLADGMRLEISPIPSQPPLVANLLLTCVVSGEDLIVRCTDSVSGQNVTVNSETVQFFSGPEFSNLTYFVENNGTPAVDIRVPGSVDSDVIQFIVDATINGMPFMRTKQCTGIADVNKIWLWPDLVVNVDGHPLLSLWPGPPPVITMVCGNDGGSPLGLTVTIEAGGLAQTFISNTPSLIVNNGKGSDPNNYTVDIGDPTSIVITYPDTFLSETLRTDVTLVVDGYVITAQVENCAGVRDGTYVWTDTTFNLNPNFQNVPPIINGVGVLWFDPKSGEWANHATGALPLSNLGSVVISAGSPSANFDLAPYVAGTYSWPLEIELYIFDWRFVGSVQAATQTKIDRIGGPSVALVIGSSLTPSVVWPFTTSAQLPPFDAFLPQYARYSGSIKIWPDGTYQNALQ